jgi:hypothetical protein
MFCSILKYDACVQSNERFPYCPLYSVMIGLQIHLEKIFFYYIITKYIAYKVSGLTPPSTSSESTWVYSQSENVEIKISTELLV